MNFVLDNDTYGIENRTVETSSNFTSQVITVRVSLLELLKQKWYLDFVTKKSNKELEREKFMFGGGAGL